MWRRLFIRLLSLSFMSCFVAGLIIEERQRKRKSANDRFENASGENEASKT
jgi:hypothetical protein